MPQLLATGQELINNTQHHKGDQLLKDKAPHNLEDKQRKILMNLTLMQLLKS